MIRVRFGEQLATINKGVWWTAYPVLQALLTSLVPDLRHEYVPDRDYAYAQYAAQKLGGTILQADPPAAPPVGAVE